jgi:hypothetical protein
MRHFLAYGNSDQASFRDPAVRDSMDFLTVPGTIAAYYPDATAAFVLSSALAYFVDLRTPLFQEHIPAPRASHYALASWLGPTIKASMGDPEAGLPVSFSPSLYSSAVIEELVASSLAAQREYGGRAPDIQKKLARYEQLLDEAMQESGESLPTVQSDLATSRPPSFVGLPYFAVSSLSDPWWDISREVWRVAEASDASDASALVAVASSFLLRDGLSEVPNGLNNTIFYWVTGLDERRATEPELLGVAEAVATRSQNNQLINLYGSFFSVCLDYVGLWGFSNGLGYSESRSWPELATTGAAPARYYLRELHAFVPPVVAQLFVDTDPSLACDCSTCAGRAIAPLSYSELKRHFALSRRWELELVRSTSPDELAASLEGIASRFQSVVSPVIPSRLGFDTTYLRTWARVLRQLPQTNP